MAKEQVDAGAAYDTIRVTRGTLDRLRRMQKEFSERTDGSITQSALINKGLDALDSVGRLAV